jgi:hypothetical protein
MLIVYCTENQIGEHWARLAQKQMEQPREKFDKDEYLARICLYSH